MTDRSPEEILDDLNELGKMAAPSELAALCDAAIDGLAEAAKFEAIEHALSLAGWTIIDTTTDDDDRTVLELVPPDAELAD